MAITWGSIVYGNGETKRSGKIGIEIIAYPSPTKVDFTINTYFASKYGVSDSSNTYYFNANASSATTSHGSKTINHTNNSGDGWTGNQTHLQTHTWSCLRTKNAQTISFSAKISGVDYIKATPEVTASYTVPALDKYSVSYHANDYPISNSLPATQYNYYGETIYVASESQRPITPGYYCVKWSTASPDNKVYEFGAPYTANASAILYACWLPYAYTISYNANGDNVSNLPVSQTANYNAAIKLAGTPVRENYNFLGWSTSPTDTIGRYVPGSTYSDWATTCKNQNETITLYAVWELAYIAPSITNVSVYRSSVDDEGNAVQDDEGKYFNVSFSWSATDPNYSVSSVVIKAGPSASPVTTYETYHSETISGSEGPISVTGLGNGTISTEDDYTVIISIIDTYKGSSVNRSLPQVAYPIDIFREGTGVAFGKPAKGPGFHVAMNAYFDKPINTLRYNIPTHFYGNCNELTTSGKYYIGNEGLNKPNIGPGAGLNGWLESTLYSTDYCFQRYTTYTGVIYERLMSAGTWSNWKLMYGYDYWTPILRSGASSWTGFSDCTYHKTGNIVHITVSCWSVITGRNSGPIQFYLPFRVASTRSYGQIGYSDLNNATYANCYVLAAGGQDFVEIMYHNSVGQQVALTGENLGRDSWTFQFSLTYGTND